MSRYRNYNLHPLLHQKCKKIPDEYRLCKSVNVRFTPSAYSGLEEVAERNHTSVCDVVREIALQYLRDCEDAEQGS